jgi:hypothetical protein
MKFSYNRLVLVGNCHSGKKFIEKLINATHSDYIINYNLETDYSFDNYFKFITMDVPNNKILFGSTSGARILCDLNKNIFKKWKFVQIDRSLYSSFYSWAFIEKIHRESKDIPKSPEVIDWAMTQETKQNILFEKIKNNGIRLNFNDIFHNTYDTVDHIFKFIEFETPKKSTIQYYKVREEMIRHLIKNKCDAGNEINLLESDKKEFKEIIDEIIKGEK